MSFDLVVWSGTTAAPSRRWQTLAESASSGPALPRAPLEAALRRAFDVREGAESTELQGRGWEISIGDRFAQIRCGWSILEEPSLLAALVRAGHAGGCSVYDPQWGAYWPAAAGLPRAADPWSAAVYDEGFTHDDAHDEHGELRVAEPAQRLCPEDSWPAKAVVYLGMWAVTPGATFLLLVSERARAYRERFPAAAITMLICGPARTSISAVALATRLGRTKLDLAPSAEARRSVTFAVLGDVETTDLAASLDVCPFELLPVSREARYLSATFQEQVISLFVVVPLRVTAAAPDYLRTALRSLHAALVSRVTSGSILYADPASGDDAPVGASLGWVEALVGLIPCETVQTIRAVDVPAVEIDLHDGNDAPA